MNTTAIIIIVLVIIGAGLFYIRRDKGPKPKSRRLAITVWAAYGPYDSPDDAEDFLHKAVQVVFGDEKDNHLDWLNGHVDNFRNWQAEGRFSKTCDFMRNGLLATAYGQPFEEAAKRLKDDILKSGIEAVDYLNKEFLETGGHKIEPVTQEDGSTQFQYKQIWSDEKIKEHKEKTGNQIIESVGANLLNDDSPEALQLLEFLREVYHANVGKELESANDAGRAWFACFNLMSEDPNSEISTSFKILNDAWSATKTDDDPDSSRVDQKEPSPEDKQQLFDKGICPRCGDEIDKSLTKCFSCDFDFYEHGLHD